MKRLRSYVIFLTILCFLMTLKGQTYPFQDKSLNMEIRIDNIISLLTLDEKISCLSTNPSVPRLGIKGTGHVEGLHGLAMGTPGNWGRDNPIPTTTFPQSIGMGQTWDTAMMRKMGEVEGYEVRYMFQSPKYNRGGLVVRAPNADIGRHPYWGRTEECYGEDAFFNGTMAVAFIRGLQGSDPEYWQAASLMKHFLANSNENTRTSSSSDFDERLLREYYAVPFKMGVLQGGSRAYMTAYNKVNGIPMMVSPLLKNLTVNEWGQNGIICTDGSALKLLISDHKYYDSLAMGASEAVKSGISQFLDDYKDAVKEGLDKGYLTEEDIDKAIRGNFRVMIKLGLLDDPDNNPYAQIGQNNEPEPWLSGKYNELVREATRKSIVLLKNDNKTLPLKENQYKSIVVVGKLANEVLYDWYSGMPPYAVTPLQAIKEKYGDNSKIRFSEYFGSAETMEIVSDADLVLVFSGNHPTGDAGWAQVTRPSYGKESVDRQTLHLEDEDSIKVLFEANQNMVLVLTSSFPYAIAWSQKNLPAIIQMSHNSQEQGHALVDVLSGAYNPAGRLVQTWPLSDEHVESITDYDIRHGGTYLYPNYKPLYPFGYGLSYTQFRYSDLKLRREKQQIWVNFNVTNTGNYDGEEVVQVYVSHQHSKVNRPKKELKGFSRQMIRKGETASFEIPVDIETLKYWNADAQTFILEKDLLKIAVGSSSENIRLSGSVDLRK